MASVKENQKQSQILLKNTPKDRRTLRSLQIYNKPGETQVGAPIKVQTNESFLNMQKNTSVEISSILQCQRNRTDEYPKDLKTIFPNWKQQRNPPCAAKNAKEERQIVKKIRFFSKYLLYVA